MNRKLDREFEVLDRLKGGEITWTDLTGTHTGTWEEFKGAVFFRLIGRLEPLNKADCPLESIDLQQFDGLDDTVKGGIYVLLRWIGFLNENSFESLIKSI